MDDSNIQFILDRFEERYAVLRHELHGEIRWPIKYLPETTRIGEPIMVCAFTEQQQKDQQYDKMRRLLEELIN